jgi:hypothetical protein
VADAICVGDAARARDDVGHGARRADVVEDRRAVVSLGEEVLGQDGGEEVAVDEAPRVVDEEAAIGVAVPRDPEVGPGLVHLVDDEAAVLLEQRVGLVVGEVAVGLPVGRDEVDPEALEQRADHRAGHAVAAVDDHLQRRDVGRVDEAQGRLVERRGHVDVLGRPGLPVGLAESRLDRAADVVDALVAAERERPRAHELCAGVGLRVVRRGAHQAAIEVARADEEVEHLGAHHPGIEDVRALGDHPGAIATAQLGRGQAHVAAQADAQLAGRFAGQAGEHAHEGAADLLGPLAVELVAVQAADVVGLEDLGDDSHRARRLAAPASRAAGRRAAQAVAGSGPGVNS